MLNYRINWYIPDQVAFVQISGVQTLEEFRTLAHALGEFVQHSSGMQIHTILDDRAVTNALKLTDIAQVVRSMPTAANLGWTLVLNAGNPLSRFTTNLASQMFKFRYRPCASLEEALDFLRAHDPEIDWSRADDSVLQPAPQ